jgi:hypothetical protein
MAKRYRQPFTHFVLFYAGVSCVATLVALLQIALGAGYNPLLLGLCLPPSIYLTMIGLNAWRNWVEVTDTGIRASKWRRIEEAKWTEIESMSYSPRGLTLVTPRGNVHITRWLNHYLELHEFVLSHLPESARVELPAGWKAELTGLLRVIAHLNLWMLLLPPSAGIWIGATTQGARGLVLAGVSFFMAYGIARFVSFPVVAIEPKGDRLQVKRALGALSLQLGDIDSLTLFEANHSPWSLHNGLRMGYGSAELRVGKRRIWIENPLCPEVLYHWLLDRGFSICPNSQSGFRKLTRAAQSPAVTES